MPELAFVMSPRQNWYLREFAETLRYELEQQDMPSTLHTDGFPEPRPETVYVVVAPHEYVALEGDGALPDEQILKRTIFVCARPAGAINLERDTDLLGSAGAVFDIDARAVAALRRGGIPARHLRPGYSKLRDAFDPEVDRSIDVMFLGAHSLRRTGRLALCARILAKHNCLLQISDDALPNAVGSPSFLADEKCGLLSRSKIVLNVHRGSDTHLEWLRVLDAIHSGAVVVTEHSSGVAPLIPGEHLLVASPESLPFVLEAALQDGELLQKIRTSVYEYVRSVLPFALPASVFRAAAVEIVGRPVPSSVSLGRLETEQRHPSAPSPSSEPEVVGVRRQLKGMSLDVIQLRRDIARLEQIVRSGADVPPRSELAYETPAWSSGGGSRVSVVVTLSNRANVVRATLDSVAEAWFRDFEVVVVDDGSADESGEIVQEWMRTHPQVPALLLRHPVSSGLGVARNTALDYVRAPYCLTLEAGDAVYPRCFEVLAGTLDTDTDAALAYPVLEVFGMTEAFVGAGGDYLLNVFGWEPERLLRWRPFEAVAMIRTDRLRELGGFAEDIEVSGWEDYDLWCRVADCGWRGQLVPQILCRYRASSARVRHLSDLPPVANLVERAPRLLAAVADVYS